MWCCARRGGVRDNQSQHGQTRNDALRHRVTSRSRAFGLSNDTNNTTAQRSVVEPREGISLSTLKRRAYKCGIFIALL